MFKTMAEVKAANKKIGHYFFSQETMKCFQSRIESRLYQKTQMFIMSDKITNGKRVFSVRKVLPDGKIETLQRRIDLYTARQICRGKL